MKPCVAFIVVAYRDYSGLRRLLARTDYSHASFHVVVVDNTEPERRSQQDLEAICAHKGITVLTPGNVGYLGAVRFAYARLSVSMSIDFVVLANSDLEVDFEELHDGLSGLPSEFGSLPIGVVAPRLLGADGEDTAQAHYVERPSARHFRRLARVFGHYHIAVGHRMLGDLKKTLKGLGRTSPRGSLDGAIFAPHGAMMIFTREYLTLNDPFGYPGFLFCEEIYVGLRAEAEGLACVYWPEITYSHLGHGSMGAVQSRTVISHLRDSHVWAAEALAARERTKPDISAS